MFQTSLSTRLRRERKLADPKKLSGGPVMTMEGLVIFHGHGFTDAFMRRFRRMRRGQVLMRDGSTAVEYGVYKEIVKTLRAKGIKETRPDMGTCR